MSLALGAIGAAAVGIPVVAFLFEPLFRKKPRLWQAVGTVNQFGVGTTTRVAFDDPAAVSWTGVTARTAAWLRRDTEEQFTAFAVYCTHLGCPVNWLADANLFLCPCHGGVYYKDGSVAGGPPPRPLTKYPVRVNNGSVEILTSPIPVG
jgi:menaquinol-cytochrome c reductase iron-sulfur subunit